MSVPDVFLHTISPLERVEICGVECDNFTMAEAVARIVDTIDEGDFAFAVTPNVDHVMKLRHDEHFREIYRNARFVLPDGVPLLWASSLLGPPLKERINGTDLFERLCEVAAARRYSIYLLGGNPGAAEGAARVLARRYPGLQVAGCDCPKLGGETDSLACETARDRIAAARPNILFVALGAPKQEEWIYEYGHSTGASFAVGIGISFSLVAGEIRRAPRWMQYWGLEWFWRLLTEPRRLWKRYLVDDLPFIGLVARDYVRQFVSKRHTHSDASRTGLGRQKVFRAPNSRGQMSARSIQDELGSQNRVSS